MLGRLEEGARWVGQSDEGQSEAGSGGRAWGQLATAVPTRQELGCTGEETVERALLALG